MAVSQEPRTVQAPAERRKPCRRAPRQALPLLPHTGTSTSGDFSVRFSSRDLTTQIRRYDDADLGPKRRPEEFACSGASCSSAHHGR